MHEYNQKNVRTQLLDHNSKCIRTEYIKDSKQEDGYHNFKDQSYRIEYTVLTSYFFIKILISVYSIDTKDVNNVLLSVWRDGNVICISLSQRVTTEPKYDSNKFWRYCEKNSDGTKSLADFEELSGLVIWNRFWNFVILT